MSSDAASGAKDLEESFKSFKDWIERQEKDARNDRAQTAELKRWKSIGRSVYERKFLVLLAAQALKKNDVPKPLRHAATDVLVEKAQLELTTRADAMIRLGAAVYAVAVGALLSGTWMLWLQSRDNPGKNEIDVPGLVLAVVRSSTMAALLFGAIYYLIALARALIAESALLLNRRHALRYLRLCVYLSGGVINLKQLHEMFNWNAELKTTFSEIDADRASGGLLINKVLETLNISVQALAEAAPRAVKSALKKE